MFPCGPWTPVKRGVEACMFLNKLFPEQQQGLAHILRTGERFLDYLLSSVFAAVLLILRGEFYSFQNNQLKQAKIFFYFSCLGLGFTQVLSVMNLLPCNLRTIMQMAQFFKCWHPARDALFLCFNNHTHIV